MTPCSALIPALKAAVAGAVIQLSGVCPYMVVNGVHAPGVYILADQATFPKRLDFMNTSGWTLIGMHSTAAGSAAMLVRGSSDFHINGTECEAPTLACVQIGTSHDFTLDQTFVDHSHCDAVDVGGSHDFKVTRTVDVRNVYDHAATSCHPDVLQFSSAPGAPMANAEVSLNVGVGDTQGIDTFDHTPLGATNLNIHDNVLVVTDKFPISQLNVSNSTAANNQFMLIGPLTLPGQKALFRGGTGNTIAAGQ